MRSALACVAILVATRAYADEPQPPTGAPPPPPTGDQTDKPAEEPKGDPAYAEKADPAPQSEAMCQGGPCADGGPGYFAAPKGSDITIKSYPDRSKTNVWGLSIAAGASVLIAGVGLYFHLDSRDESDKINAHKFTGDSWTPERAAIYDNANASATKAGVFYGIGAAALLGTVIAYIATEPKMETTVIHPHRDPKPTALVAPMRGGALVGGTWSF